MVLPPVYSALFCGKAVCYWSFAELVKTDIFDVQYTYLGGQVCVSAHLRVRNDQTKDDTYIRDGTICGNGQVNIPFLDAYVLSL